MVSSAAPTCPASSTKTRFSLALSLSSLSLFSPLSLEGDFNEYFTLYCPGEYERDALYVFTPDVMALLIDQTSAFDVEVVDDWMFVYSAQPLPALNPVMWQRMFRIVNTVGAKTLDQTEHYRDERMVPAGETPLTAATALTGSAGTANRIAPEGRRLKKGFNWFTLAIGAVIAVVWLWMIFGARVFGNWTWQLGPVSS